MRLTERTDALCTKTFRDKNKNLWKYIPVKQAGDKKITPQDIAGDAGYRAKKAPVGILTREDGEQEKKLDVLPSARSSATARGKPDTFRVRMKRENFDMSE